MAGALGHYVYALVDPRTDEIFYVGKGVGSRFGAHEKEAMASVGRSDKAARIREILAAGQRPRVDIIRHALADDAAALLVEAAVIDALRPQLTNVVAGHGEGRLPLEELKVRYAAPLLGDDVPPALMVRLSSWQHGRLEIEPGYFRSGHGWRSGMSQIELADSTRAWWKISPKSARARGVEHAVAVFDGITRAVFHIDSWFGPNSNGRHGFAASPISSGDHADSYFDHVGKRLPAERGSQNPVTYWPRSV